MIKAGDRIDNYTMLKRLGSNTFGDVWVGRESITERFITVNFMTSDDAYQITRFTRAISLLGRLNHPNIVAHTGHGFHHHLPYLATEHVQGPTLAGLMAKGGRMDEGRVLRLAAQVADALDHAWRTAEIIHRNLGPETLLVDLASMRDDGEIQVKIIDFGHALGKRLVDRYDRQQVEEEEAFQRAAQQEVVGTPLTMSPEQIRHAALTVGSDMYSLGVTMHLLLSGSPPFTGSDDELRAAHLRATPHDLQQLVPGLHTGTAAIVRRLLAKNSNGRFPDWATCRDKLMTLVDQVENSRAPRAPRMPRTNQTTTTVRRTTTYERTPEGVSTPGRSPSLYAPASPVSAPADPQSGIPLPGMPNIEQQALMLALAERVRSLPPTAGSTAAPSATPPAGTSRPWVDDGMNADQRAALWAFLFNHPAIREASVQVAAEAPAPTPAKASEPTPEPELIPEEALPTFTEESSAALLTLDQAIVAPIPEPAYRAATERRTRPREVASDPLRSPFWKQAIEILRQAIIGRVRYRNADGQGFTARITSRLKRMIGSRDDVLAEIRELLDHGSFDRAWLLIEKLAAQDGKNALPDRVAESCLLRARVLALRGDFAGALPWAQEAVGQHSFEPSALAMVGVLHLLARRVRDANAIFAELANVHPESPFGPLGQGTIYLLSGLDSKAEPTLTDALQREPHPAVVRMQALRCRILGDGENEVALLRSLLTGSTSDWEIQERIDELTGGGRRGDTGTDDLA